MLTLLLDFFLKAQQFANFESFFFVVVFKVSTLSHIIQNDLSNLDSIGMFSFVIFNVTARYGGHVA